MIEKVFEMLKKLFGIEELDFELKEMGKGKIYAFKPCNLSIEEIHSGVYLGRVESNGFRLSIEGSYLIGKKAKKGVVEIDRARAIRWMRGKDIEEGKARGYVILKYNKYFLGCGWGDGRRIRNFVPKNRRI
jgi:NOL1/NOP2/fmu family ribosome biogenesis protein